MKDKVLPISWHSIASFAPICKNPFTMGQLEFFDNQEIRAHSESTQQVPSLEIANRKYLGSKARLIGFIRKEILAKVPSIGIFFDAFSGTGVVAHSFRNYAEKLIANDMLYSNFVVNRAYLSSNSANCALENISKHLSRFSALEPIEGYVYHSYGGTYFSPENAGRIDAVREAIEAIAVAGECTEQEKYILLTSLLFAIDKVANTVGQYDAYLKHLGKDVFDARGKHVIDSNVYKRLRLLLPKIEIGGHHAVHNEDANALARRVHSDVAYLDPPYNNRQYIDNYHVLENIMCWKKPPLLGKTLKFERGNLKSAYSRKTTAVEALSDLISNLDCTHVFLSYNNEGIIAHEQLIELLSAHGEPEVVEEEYGVFGNGAGQSVKRRTVERLYHCRLRR